MSAHHQHALPLPVSLEGKTPSVVIVGAGLAGLLLGILLDKAGIPYQIYERAQEVRPLGKAGNSSVFLEDKLFETWHSGRTVLIGDAAHKTFLERCARHLVFNYMPRSVHVKASSRGMAYRPQASFLPLVSARGNGRVFPQKPSRKYQEKQSNTNASATPAMAL
ncbi:hypothetical protein KVV02_005223 [Mortierella alpina]|uniref:FAD-binding domain-containing protein n=1 Tax=Mortierella alpina TaxID=64518 RepID=A0A9P7ZZ22_MORAP|nr:hypothetical protein KVV02_005223 [Mortierella alpina]